MARRATVALLILPVLTLGCSTAGSTDGASVDASTDRPTLGTPPGT